MSIRQRRDGKNPEADQRERDIARKIESHVAGVVPVVSEVVPVGEVRTETASFANEGKDVSPEDEKAETVSDKENKSAFLKRKIVTAVKKDKIEEQTDAEESEDSEADALLEDFRNNKKLRSQRRLIRKQKRENRRRAFLERLTKKRNSESSGSEKTDIIGTIREKIEDVRSHRREVLRAQNLDTNLRIRIEQNKRRIRMAAAVIAAAALVIGVIIYSQVRVFVDYTVVSTQERTDDSATVYVNLNRYRLKCNPNGVTCVDNNNNVIWNTTFTMQSLMVEQCGQLVAVAGQRGNEVYIFDEKGLVANFDVEHTLLKMKLTNQGNVAAVLEDGELTWISLYDKEGEIIIRNRTTMAETGYPLDMDISSDSRTMMVSFLGVGDDIESTVKFYRFSSAGQDIEDKIVNEEVYKSRVIPEVKFMSGNYSIAFGDDGATIFRGGQIPEEYKSVQVTSEIISSFSNDKYFGFITENDETEGKNAEHKYKMMIYRENGSKCGTSYFDFDYTNIAIGEKQVVLYDNDQMEVYDMTGKKKCSISYGEEQISEIVPANSIRRYTILTEDRIDTIKVK